MSISDTNYLDLYESTIFKNIKLTPRITKNIFVSYGYEILDKDISLYVAEYYGILFKFSSYPDSILYNIIMTEFSRTHTSYMLYYELISENFEIMVPFFNLPGVKFLYDYLISGKEYLEFYMDDSSWRKQGNLEYNDRNKKYLRFDKSVYTLKINKKHNNYGFKVYNIGDDINLIGPMKVTDPVEFTKKILIHLSYYRISYKIKIL